MDKLEKAPAGTYDLILTDIQMPNKDVYKATKVIRSLPESAELQQLFCFCKKPCPIGICLPKWYRHGKAECGKLTLC